MFNDYRTEEEKKYTKVFPMFTPMFIAALFTIAKLWK
jgi:hypothetical protein